MKFSTLTPEQVEDLKVRLAAAVEERILRHGPLILHGARVYEWTLIEYKPGKGTLKAKWTCRCSCGAIRDVQKENLEIGRSKSCGHLAKGT